MFTRFAAALTSGTFITLSLFWVMNHLIAMQPGVVTEPRDPWRFTFLPQMDDEPVIVDNGPEFTPEQLTETEPTPPRPEHAMDTGTIGVRLTQPPAPPSTGGFVPGALNDGPLVAIVRVRPVYPIRAQEQGIEGHVLVQFDVTAEGTVTNITVIESSHRVFENSAIDAAKRFRFKPRVVDGVPQPTTGLQNLFTFEMEQG